MFQVLPVGRPCSSSRATCHVLLRSVRVLAEGKAELDHTPLSPLWLWGFRLHGHCQLTASWDLSFAFQKPAKCGIVHPNTAEGSCCGSR